MKRMHPNQIKQYERMKVLMDEAIGKFSVDESCEFALIDISNFPSDVLFDSGKYINGTAVLKRDTTDGKHQILLRCKLRFMKAIIESKRDPGHMACMLNTRFTDEGMMIFCKELFLYWKQYLAEKKARADANASIVASKLSNPGGQTDAKLHRELMTDLRRHTSFRSLAREMREERK